MKQISWEDPQKKRDAYAYLAKVFSVSKGAISLAMSFKRNSLEAGRMRHVAVSQLGGILLTDEEKKVQSVKILNSKGEVEKVVSF